MPTGTASLRHDPRTPERQRAEHARVLLSPKAHRDVKVRAAASGVTMQTYLERLLSRDNGSVTL